MAKMSSYTISRDYGFAPNPFWGYCTLATCKPKIRGFSVIGDYVVGFGGKDTGKHNKLIFVMRVEEILSFDEYWFDERFIIKKPNIYGSLKVQYGDNIYHKDENGTWNQLIGHHSTHENLPIEGNIKNDTSYNNVLISKDEWWYFGDQAPEIPLSFQKFIHKRNHKYFFKDSDYFELIEWVIANYPKRGRYGLPNEWIKIRDNYESK